MPRKRLVEVDGHTYPSAYDAWLAEAKPNIKYTTFMYRLQHGWEAWRALRVKPLTQEASCDELDGQS